MLHLQRRPVRKCSAFSESKATFNLTQKMKEKLIRMISMFPVVLSYTPAQWLATGYTMEEVEAAKAEIETRAATMSAGLMPEKGSAITAAATYGALNWNVVIEKAVKGWTTQQLAPLVEAFSTDISGETVVASNPQAMPRITVPVYNIGDDTAVLDPTDLDALNSGNAFGVPVQLHLLGDGVEIPVDALMGGYTAENIVAGCVESVRRKAMKYVLSQVTANCNTTEAKPVAKPATVTVPALDKGWSSGWVNRNLSDMLEEPACLLVNRQYMGGMRRDDTNGLTFDQLGVDGVYKVDQVSALGENAIGLLAAKNSMVVGMRAPVLVGPAYPVVMQFVDGETRLPLTMVQYFVPGKMTMHVKVLTAVGAARVNAAACRVLVAGE